MLRVVTLGLVCEGCIKYTSGCLMPLVISYDSPPPLPKRCVHRTRLRQTMASGQHTSNCNGQWDNCLSPIAPGGSRATYMVFALQNVTASRGCKCAKSCTEFIHRKKANAIPVTGREGP
jgi:hypothetical protein